MKIHFHGAEDDGDRLTWELHLPSFCLSSSAKILLRYKRLKSLRDASPKGSQCPCWCHWLVLSCALWRHKGVELQELLCRGSSHPLLAPCGAEGEDGGTWGFLRRHVGPAPRWVALG